jgi:general stress protein YciG
MNPDKQREIASKGGRAAHEQGTAHEWTREQAREAGRKGGLASSRKRRLSPDAPSTAEPHDASVTYDLSHTIF